MMWVILTVSTTTGVIRRNWILRWACLEVNILSICWILSQRKRTKREKKQEKALIYFIVQTSASIIILTAFIIENSILTIIRLFSKIGMWPVHSWFVKIINKIEIRRTPTIILITWQKILPVSLIINLNLGTKERTILIVIITLTLVIPLCEISRIKRIKRIIILSAINNNSWIILASMWSIRCFVKFLILYSSRTAVILKTIEITKIKRKKSQKEFWLRAIAVANTSGIPPMTIFWAKAAMIKALTKTRRGGLIAITLVTSATLIRYHYMSATLTEIIKTPQKENLKKEKKKTVLITAIIVTSTIRVIAFH